MLEVFEKISNIISEFEIGVLLVGKDQRIWWENDYVLKRYESKGNLIGKNCDVVMECNDNCKDVLNSSFSSNEIKRII